MERSMSMNYKEASRLIMSEVETALSQVDEDQVAALAEMITGSEKVFLVGVGRVLLSLQAFAKRLNHLGIPAFFVGEINEPALTPKDLLIVGSGSGESLFPVAIAKKAKGLGAKVVHIGSNPQSAMAPVADLLVRIPVQTKLGLPDELQSKQIMSSLFEQSLLLLGDAVALMIASEKNLDIKALWRHHANLE